MNPGDLVVCINVGEFNDGCVRGEPRPELELGRLYSIRDAFVCPMFGHWVVRLHEIRRDCVYGTDWPFAAERFRPVRPTSIECFRELLETAPKELEPAP